MINWLLKLSYFSGSEFHESDIRCFGQLCDHFDSRKESMNSRKRSILQIASFSSGHHLPVQVLDRYNVGAVGERVVIDVIVLLGRDNYHRVRVHDARLQDRVYVVDGSLHPVDQRKAADCL